MSYTDWLKQEYGKALHITKQKFPNSKLAYLSNRIYAGYTITTQNPEPYAYYTGWSVKKLIEDQINGDTSLNFHSPNATVPWLSWGADLWADGTTARLDGLTWICSTDYNNDGTHPSKPFGVNKVANLLFKFFSTDETTMPWFLKNAPSNLTENHELMSVKIFPNPGHDEVMITSSKVIREVLLSNIQGQIVLHSFPDKNELLIPTHSLPKGVYFLKISALDNVYFEKLLIY